VGPQPEAHGHRNGRTETGLALPQTDHGGMGFRLDVKFNGLLGLTNSNLMVIKE
jgi:hypothetical protein